MERLQNMNREEGSDPEKKLEELFREIDLDNDGFLSR